jgi:hypothetical protein
LKSDAARQLFTRLMAQGKPLGELVEGRMYRGVLTGLNEAFIIAATRNRLVKADPACTHLIKPMVRGEDLRPWYQEDEGRWLICLPSGWTEHTFPELQSLEALARERLAMHYPGLATYLDSIAETARNHITQGQFWWEWERSASEQTNLSSIFFLDDETKESIAAFEGENTPMIKPRAQPADGKNWLLVVPDGWTLETFPELESTEALAWEKLTARYPALTDYLEPFADRARRRQDRGRFWWELRPCDYYGAFELTKIFFPDITKKPRFNWGEAGTYTSNTGYFIPTESYELLSILNSRTTWFIITNMSQPLGERKGALIYRLFTQFMERLPIPKLNKEQRDQLATLTQQLTEVARQRYRLRREMDQRIQSDLGNGQGKFTKRLQEWWLLPWQAFREEVHKSFKNDIPLRERGEWEALLREQREEIERLTAKIVRLEKLLNTVVYDIFNLSEQEIKIIEQETRYQYGEW